MDAIEVKVNVNQRRQTRWLKDYHESYRKKLEERKNAVISEAEKEKRSKKERAGKAEYHAQQRKRHLLSLHEATQ